MVVFRIVRLYSYGDVGRLNLRMEDDELVKASQQGDPKAFSILVERYSKEAFNLAMRMLGNIPDAEDVCQNSWMAAWKAISRFRGGSFRSWILSIVANACRDEFRRRKRKASISIFDSPLPPLADPKANTAKDYEMIEAVREALLHLPHEQRLAVTLREFDGLDYHEIAEVMRCSVGTVRSRLNRGRTSLRDLLREKGILE